MENKLHIKAVAGRNIKVDADWYRYGDNIDCYLTPAQFKDYVKGFLDFDIIMDEDSSPKSIDAEYTIIEPKLEEKKEEVIKDEQILEPKSNEGATLRKGTKKVSK